MTTETRTASIPANILERIDEVTIDCDHPNRRRRHAYVIAVEPLTPSCRVEFYVGSTGLRPRRRLKQHRRRATTAARLFTKARAWPAALREDLTVRIPTRVCDQCAKNAEGVLAHWVDQALGRVDSDRLIDGGTPHARPKIRPYRPRCQTPLPASFPRREGES